MLGIVARHTCGLLGSHFRHVLHQGRLGDPLLDLTDSCHVFIEFTAIGAADLAGESLRVVRDEVENALAVFLPALASGFRFPVAAIREETLEDQLGIDFLRDRLGFRLPCNVGRVGTAVAGIAAA